MWKIFFHLFKNRKDSSIICLIKIFNEVNLLCCFWISIKCLSFNYICCYHLFFNIDNQLSSQLYNHRIDRWYFSLYFHVFFIGICINFTSLVENLFSINHNVIIFYFHSWKKRPSMTCCIVTVSKNWHRKLVPFLKNCINQKILD